MNEKLLLKIYSLNGKNKIEKCSHLKKLGWLVVVYIYAYTSWEKCKVQISSLNGISIDQTCVWTHNYWIEIGSKKLFDNIKLKQLVRANLICKN